MGIACVSLGDGGIGGHPFNEAWSVRPGAETAMTIPKMQEKFRRDNLDSARRIMSDPKYQEGSLLKIWARSYLAKAAAEAGKRANDRH